MQQPVVSLWIGGSLGPIERLSLASFLAHGHPVALYAYDEVRDVPQGVELRDAATLFPRRLAEENRYANGSWALFSNLFRFELQKRSLGLWVDADVVAVRPVALTGPFVVGRESDRFLNGAVLGLSPDSPVLRDLLAAYAANRVPPWIRFDRASLAYLRQWLGRPVPPNRQPHGTYGPKAITALAERHGLTGAAQPEEVFYPVHPRQAESIYQPGLGLDSVLTERTLTVHLWNEKLGALKRSTPPRDSILGELVRRYQV